jgi:urease accessory protein UreH
MGYTGITGYEFQDRLVIELVDLDVAANNLNLPKIVSSVLGPKLLSENNMIEDEIYEIYEQMRSQKLFAGHTWDDAQDIVSRYFNSNYRQLSKEVLKISQAYERVFRPYRIVYDTKTWEPVLM